MVLTVATNDTALEHAAHVGLLYEPFCAPISEAMNVGEGEHVLDMWSRAGDLLRHLAKARPKPGSLTGLDPDAPFVFLAEERYGDIGVSWRCGTPWNHPFREGSFDVLVNAFGLHENADDDLAKIRFTLKRGGRVVLATWRTGLPGDPRRVIAEILDRHLGAEVSGPYIAQFGFGSPSFLKRLANAAGFTEIGAATRRTTAEFQSIEVLLSAELTAINRQDHLSEGQRVAIAAEARNRLRSRIKSGGRVAIPLEAVIVRGRRMD